MQCTILVLLYYRFQSYGHRNKEIFCLIVRLCIRGLTFKDIYWHLAALFILCTQVKLLSYILHAKTCCTVSHLDSQLFEPSVHSRPELRHLLLQSNQVPLPRAHVSAQPGNAGITPEVIGGESERDNWMRALGWEGVEERCEDREMSKGWREQGGNALLKLAHFTQSTNRQMDGKKIRQLPLSIFLRWTHGNQKLCWILSSDSWSSECCANIFDSCSGYMFVSADELLIR